MYNQQWHIDHIKPIAAFSFDKCTTIDEIKQMLQIAFHYTNLQPMWGEDNIKKSSLYNGTRHTLKLPKLDLEQEKTSKGDWRLALNYMVYIKTI